MPTKLCRFYVESEFTQKSSQFLHETLETFLMNSNVQSQFTLRDFKDEIISIHWTNEDSNLERDSIYGTEWC